MLKLEDALGKPFQGNVPAMEHAELRSAAERLVFTYGPKNFNATQAWIDSPARVEQLAPAAWDIVADTLGVQRTVQRVGARFIFHWKIDSLEEGREALASSGLVLLAGGLAEALRDAKQMAWSIVVEDHRGRLRLATDLTEFNVDGALPEELAALVSKYAIVLDLDHTHPGVVPYQLTRGELKDFIRTSWQRSKSTATMFRSHLGSALGQ